MTESDLIGLTKQIEIVGEIAFEFARFRLLRERDVAGEELELLRDPPPGNRIILGEPDRHRLTIENILSDIAVGHAVEFVAGRRATPAHFPLADKRGDAIGIDPDGPVVDRLGRRAIQRIGAVNAGTDDQELEQRLPNQPNYTVTHGHFLDTECRNNGGGT